MTDRPPTLLEIERLRQGLLDPATARLVQARVDAFGDPAADLPTDATTFADDPPDRFLRNVAAVAAQTHAASRRRRLRLAVPLLAAAVALIAVGPGLFEPDTPDIILKGEADLSLRVVKDTPSGPIELADGAAAHEGDRLQLSFAARGLTHGLLYSVDGRGTVTVHHRFAGELPPSGSVTLPTAYQLDDAPRFEAFHLVGSDRPFDTDTVLEAAEAAGRAAPELPDGVFATSLVLDKDAP